MKIGYIITDFPVWGENGALTQLKTVSYVIKDSVYGNVLIDAGSPYAENEFVNSLYNLFGLKPLDIDYVLCTHCHPDHLGLAYLFTNARIILSQKDYQLYRNLVDHYLSGKSVYDYMIEYCGDYKTTFSRVDEENVKKYLNGKWCTPDVIDKLSIEFIEDKPDILTFIKPILTKGHTFDHYAYLLNTDVSDVLFCGDAVANRMILLTDNNVITEAQMSIQDFHRNIEFIKGFDCVLCCGHDIPFNTTNYKSYRRNTIFEKC